MLKRKGLNEKGFSLSELGIAMVIMLILATIAVIGYFSFIDDTNEVKMKTEARQLQDVLVTEDILEYSEEASFDELDDEVKEVLAYHYLNGTNLRHTVFENKVIHDKDKGEKYLGLLTMKDTEEITETDIENVNLEIRKLDENEVNSLYNNKFSGEWYIVASSNGDGIPDRENEEEDEEGIVEAGSFNSNFMVIEERLTCEEAENQGYTCISTPEELDEIRNELDGKFILVSDIDLSGMNWEPIGDYNMWLGFTGIFNGNGYEIKNLTVNKPSYSGIGLFALIESAEVKNLGLSNVSVNGKSDIGGLSSTVSYSDIFNVYVIGGNISGSSRVGGLIGFATNNEIKDSYIEGRVKGKTYVGGLIGQTQTGNEINNTYTTGNIEGERYVGGLIGNNTESNIVNSYAIGNVKSENYTGNSYVGGLVGQNFFGEIIKSYATGNIYSDGKEVGGLIGSNQGLISNSYATGNVTGIERVGGLLGGTGTGSEVVNSYSTGKVEATIIMGGFIGNNRGTVSNSYWNIEKSEQLTSSGGQGLLEHEMKRESSFEGWDFDNVWRIDEGNGYPTLR